MLSVLSYRWQSHLAYVLRVESEITLQSPHRSGRDQLSHPVPQLSFFLDRDRFTHRYPIKQYIVVKILFKDFFEFINIKVCSGSTSCVLDNTNTLRPAFQYHNDFHYYHMPWYLIQLKNCNRHLQISDNTLLSIKMPQWINSRKTWIHSLKHFYR